MSEPMGYWLGLAGTMEICAQLEKIREVKLWNEKNRKERKMIGGKIGKQREGWLLERDRE